MVLIPKCNNPSSMKDLRPISLCNVVYKILSKAMANRLKFLLLGCVAEEQATFIANRSISNNIIVASEVIHYLRRRKKGKRGEVALKIDISKAYDEVNCGDLNAILTKIYGF